MKKLIVFSLLLVASTCIAIAVNTKTQRKTVSETKEFYDCKRCNGTGVDPYTQNCPSCHGTRKVVRSEYCSPCSGTGFVKDRFGDKVVCPTCKGERMKITKETCGQCSGTGSAPMKCMNCKGSGKVER